MFRISRKLSIHLSLAICTVFFLVCVAGLFVLPALTRMLIDLPDNIGNRGEIAQGGRAFVLAMETGLPLVPVFMRCAPFYKGGSRISIGKPVQVKKKDAIDRSEVEKIMTAVREMVYDLSLEEKKG